jgi:hypothetical protein
MMIHSLYDAEASTPTDDRESPPLPFEAEFDGVRREIARPEQPMLDPSRYWDLHGGTD